MKGLLIFDGILLAGAIAIGITCNMLDLVRGNRWWEVGVLLLAASIFHATGMLAGWFIRDSRPNTGGNIYTQKPEDTP